MSLVFRICTLSVVLGLSACGQSEGPESSSGSSGDDNTGQAKALSSPNSNSPATPEQRGTGPEECEHFQQLQEFLPDERTIDGLNRSASGCMDASARATYEGEGARYVFSVQVLDGQSPWLEPFIESMAEAPEPLVNELRAVIEGTGELFRAGYGICERLSEAEHHLGMPRPRVTDPGVCVMKEDGLWTGRKLFSQDLGLMIEYSGTTAESLNDSQQAAEKLSPLFDGFAMPGR